MLNTRPGNAKVGMMLNATKGMRHQARMVIDAKLTGNARAEAISFIASAKRDDSDLEKLIDRLSVLPDIERDCNPQTQLTPAIMLEIEAAIRQGVSIANLARRFQVAESTIYRKTKSVRAEL